MKAGTMETGKSDNLFHEPLQVINVCLAEFAEDLKWISDVDSQEALAQCIIRNTFSLEKITYQRETGTVLYTSKMTQCKKPEELQGIHGQGIYCRHHPTHPGEIFSTCALLRLVLQPGQGRAPETRFDAACI